MHSVLASIVNFLRRDFLAGSTEAMRGERNFRITQGELESTIEENLPASPEITDAAITAHTEGEASRRKSVEEKARSNLTVVSVCSTLVLTGLSFLVGQGVTVGSHTRLLLVILFLLAVAYFVGGVVCALRALQITRTWVVNTDDEAQTVEILRGLRLLYFELNKLETNIKANWTSVSFTCLRNAVISLLLFAATVGVLITRPTKSTTALSQASAPVPPQPSAGVPTTPQSQTPPSPACCCPCPQAKARPSTKHQAPCPAVGKTGSP